MDNLFFVPSNGLGDKLLDLTSFLLYCNAHNYIPNVEWCENENKIISKANLIRGLSIYDKSLFEFSMFKLVTFIPAPNNKVMISKDPSASLSLYKITNNRPTDLDILSYKTIARSAIKPSKLIESCIPPEIPNCIGIHLRKSDKVGNHIDERYESTESDYLNIIECLKKKIVDNLTKDSRFFICSEDIGLKTSFELWLKVQGADVIKINSAESPINGFCQVLDFFSLSRCKEIYQGSQHSSFSCMEIILGDIPIYNFGKHVSNSLLYIIRPLLNLKCTGIKTLSSNEIDQTIKEWADPEIIINQMKINFKMHRNIPGEKKDIELVIARFNENLDWVKNVPKFYKIKIYNKFMHHDTNFKFRARIKRDTLEPSNNIISLSNVGREADTYLTHIIDNYEKLSNITVFCQGDPFPHSPDFLDLLDYYDQFNSVQCLTDRYLDMCPTEDIRNQHTDDFICNKRVCAYPMNTKTFDVLWFNDIGSRDIGTQFRSFFKIDDDANLVDTVLQENGFNLPKAPDVIKFPYGAMFSVEKKFILQHPKEAYINLRKINNESGFNLFPHVMERMWMYMFSDHIE